MKRVLIVLGVVGVMVSAAAAAQMTRAAPAGAPALVPEVKGPARVAPPATVGQLRGRQITKTPVTVKATAASTAISVAGRAINSKSYSEGSGVVLDAAHMKHAQTQSTVFLYSVYLTPTTAEGIAKGESNISVTQSQSREAGKKIVGGYKAYTFGSVAFKNLPTGVHTYVLTLGSFHFQGKPAFAINGTEWHVDDVIVNKEAHEAQLLLLLDGDKQDQLLLDTGAAFPDNPNVVQLTGMGFYYVQLAQVK